MYHLGDGQVVELERQPVRQELIQNQTQGVYIRASVDSARVAHHLFGAHVAQRADNLAGARLGSGAEPASGIPLKHQQDRPLKSRHCPPIIKLFFLENHKLRRII